MNPGQEAFETSSLLDRYLVGLDDDEIDDAWVRGLFTEDAAVVFPISRHDGIEGLAGYHRASLEAFAATQHHGSPAVVTVDEDGEHATFRANVLTTHVHHPGAPGEPLFQAGTLASGEARRGPEGWRMSVLSFQVLWIRGTPPNGAEKAR
ncbi:nuclear transport factor 2 family protein [Streptomyces sp. NPDC091271]|uniref:nuclear transport factor 2 family protein n=1 Tax=Streptomyces sp. NPDC091271 TaxID=3365980 RepID=UPI0038002EB8